MWRETTRPTRKIPWTRNGGIKVKREEKSRYLIKLNGGEVWRRRAESGSTICTKGGRGKH